MRLVVLTWRHTISTCHSWENNAETPGVADMICDVKEVSCSVILCFLCSAVCPQKTRRPTPHCRCKGIIKLECFSGWQPTDFFKHMQKHPNESMTSMIQHDAAGRRQTTSRTPSLALSNRGSLMLQRSVMLLLLHTVHPLVSAFCRVRSTVTLMISRRVCKPPEPHGAPERQS